MKKHIQLIESALTENPLAAVGSLARAATRKKIPTNRALTVADQIPPSVDTEIAQRITVLKSVMNLKDQKDVLTVLDQSYGLLKAIDGMPESLVLSAFKRSDITLNSVRKLAKRIDRLKSTLEDTGSLDQTVLKRAIKEAAEIKSAAKKAADSVDVESTENVIRNAVAIASAGGLAGMLAAAALDQKKELEPNEAGSLGKLETE